MATTTLQSKASDFSTKNVLQEDVSVKIPQSDMVFFQLFAEKMGWLINRKQDLWGKYVEDSPQNVPLTDEEIIEEVRAVRYGKT
jgi:hypothetical protein